MRKMLGRRVRDLRTSRGMTQEELGELANINYKYLGGIERGERNPSLENLARIASGLGVRLRDLFVLEHEIPTLSGLKAHVAETLASADEKKLRQVARLLDALLE
ncbi:MAG: XRE family transcriptional regulator [Desulfarculus sp.]|nr:MAG: XRE family transcriptional regulator [Desulfarculus sp.]